MMTSVIGFLFIASFNVYAAEVTQFSENHLEAAILEVMGKKDSDEVTVSKAIKLQVPPPITMTSDETPTINGADDIEIPYGKEFNLLEGITAIDADGVDLTSEIVIEGEVDVFTTGDYEIVYRVTDHEGQTETVNRLVTVGTPVIGNQSPVINAEDRIIGKGNDFDPFEGVTAQDAEDGDLTAAIEIVQNTVNINEIGIYEVTYRVQDSNGATTIVSVNIEVHDIPTTGFSLF